MNAVHTAPRSTSVGADASQRPHQRGTGSGRWLWRAALAMASLSAPHFSATAPTVSASAAQVANPVFQAQTPFQTPRAGANQPVHHFVSRLSTLATETNAGVQVAGVLPQSEAERGGLQANDVIISVDGQSARTVADLERTLRAKPANATVALGVTRGGANRTLSIKLVAETTFGSANGVIGIPFGASSGQSGFVPATGQSGFGSVPGNGPTAAGVPYTGPLPGGAPPAGAATPGAGSSFFVAAPAPGQTAGQIGATPVSVTVVTATNSTITAAPAGAFSAFTVATPATGAGAAGQSAPSAASVLVPPSGVVAPGAVTAPSAVTAPANVMAGAALGLFLIDSSGGVAVELVLPGTNAEAAGVQVGDLIVAIDGQTVVSADDLWVELVARLPGETVTLTIKRADATVEAKLTLGGPNP